MRVDGHHIGMTWGGGMTTAARRPSSLLPYRIIEPMVEMQMIRQAPNRLFNMTVSNFMAVLLGKCGEMFKGDMARPVPTGAMAAKAHSHAVCTLARSRSRVSADTALPTGGQWQGGHPTPCARPGALVRMSCVASRVGADVARA